MKSDKMSYVRRVLIIRRPPDVPVRVSLRSYARFADWLDGELDKLVARWSPHPRRPPHTEHEKDGPSRGA